MTEFKFKCAEIGTHIYAGPIVKKFEDIDSYVRFHREYVRTMPDEMTIWMVVRYAPPLPFIPQDTHGKLVILVPFVWLGDPERGKELTRPIREITDSVGDGSAVHAYKDWQFASTGWWLSMAPVITGSRII